MGASRLVRCFSHLPQCQSSCRMNRPMLPVVVHFPYLDWLRSNIHPAAHGPDFAQSRSLSVTFQVRSDGFHTGKSSIWSNSLALEETGGVRRSMQKRSRPAFRFRSATSQPKNMRSPFCLWYCTPAFGVKPAFRKEATVTSPTLCGSLHTPPGTGPSCLAIRSPTSAGRRR